MKEKVNALNLRFQTLNKKSENMELTLRIYGLINKIINYLLAPFLYLYFDAFGKNGKVPALKNPILEISAVDLAEKIRSREVSVLKKANLK